LLYQAAKELGIDLGQSVMIGDKISDLEAGWRAGCATVLVFTRYGHETYEQLAEQPFQPDHVCADLTHSVDWFLKRKGEQGSVRSAIRTGGHRPA
jgi:D-glycero-D-manno-heptose 1,7-bisphosphate phosphatase